MIIRIGYEIKVGQCKTYFESTMTIFRKDGIFFLLFLDLRLENSTWSKLKDRSPVLPCQSGVEESTCFNKQSTIQVLVEMRLNKTDETNCPRYLLVVINLE